MLYAGYYFTYWMNGVKDGERSGLNTEFYMSGYCSSLDGLWLKIPLALS